MKNLSSADEAASRAEAIATLAEQTHQPLPVVKEIYEEIFAQLKANARVHGYVALFATRRAKAVLRSRT